MNASASKARSRGLSSGAMAFAGSSFIEPPSWSRLLMIGTFVRGREHTHYRTRCQHHRDFLNSPDCAACERVRYRFRSCSKRAPIPSRAGECSSNGSSSDCCASFVLMLAATYFLARAQSGDQSTTPRIGRCRQPEWFAPNADIKSAHPMKRGPNYGAWSRNGALKQAVGPTKFAQVGTVRHHRRQTTVVAGGVLA